ncbi:MFS transporter [Altericroceibacterium endophyticum]|uniref:MFS transporter n=1 Tax=Altericroceibacterium endophyticum TaxID=1808508 RepID=A0A6I4T2R9_9SPHN|nr:MFS transporter [Altericroceibacterium endophyticum]MXO65247.1 MFS transporter [Altericroceibacterium endophyticum]
MALLGINLAPQTEIGPDEMQKGMDRLILEAAFSSATTALTSGVILTAFALYLGASNMVVGLLASAPFLGQLLQGPAILLVEKVRQRKKLSFIACTLARSMLLVMAAAVFLPRGVGLATVVAAQCLLCGISAFSSCPWNAWLRDLTPDRELGDVVARRTVYATVVSLGAGLIAAFTLDQPGKNSDFTQIVYCLLYLAGFIASLFSSWLVGRIPEPAMPPAGPRISLRGLLAEPFRDPNFRHLIRFLVSWQFAANLATPFFTVYLLRQLNFDMTFVMGLSIASQLANLLALRNWGTLSDLFANKSVLAVAAPTYILCITMMIGASQIEDRTMLMAYLLVLHVLMGFAVAGVTLATSNIALRLSPRGGSTAYVASAALASSFAAGTAPLLGGIFADFFAERRFQIMLRWVTPQSDVLVSPLELSSWDFYFLIAGIFGLYALHRLAFIREEGEIERRDMIQQMLHQTRRSVRSMSTVAGFRGATEFPVNMLREARLRTLRRKAIVRRNKQQSRKPKTKR